MPVARVARIASQLLKALMEAHAQGVVHRDVKPENVIIVHHAGEADFVKLLDFGVARPEVGAALTGDGSVIGTPRYMAPEQLRGSPVDARCDLYSLGLVMAEALTGEPVYASDSPLEVYAAKSSSAPTPLALAPVLAASAIGQVIVRATQRDPGARFGSAVEMLRALEHATLGAAGWEASLRPPPVRSASPEASSTTAQPAVLTIPRPRPRSSAGLVLGVVGGVLALFAIVIVAGVLVSRALPTYGGVGARPPAEPAEPGTNGVLTNVNEATLRTRIERHGLKVGAVSRNDHGTGCSWTELEVVTLTSGGYHVFLFECASRALAANQMGNLRKFPGGWLTADGTRILWCGLADEAASRELCAALVDPPLGGGRR